MSEEEEAGCIGGGGVCEQLDKRSATFDGIIEM